MRASVYLCTLAFAVVDASAATAHSQGPNGHGMVVNDPSIGTVPWDIGYCPIWTPCVATVGFPPMFGGVSQYLKATGFGFTVPNNAVIEGIQVDLDRAGISTWDHAARIVKAGSVGLTDRSYLGGYPDGPWPVSTAVAQYGGPNDLWGEAWTAAAINDPNFGFALSVFLVPPPDYGVASVNSISITVFYSLCGDGEIGASEQCDDGNTINGDCCSATCQNETSCDDGIFCNGTDTCIEGACTHSGDPCLSGPFCAASCNEIADTCFLPTDTPCPDDGDPCTIDTCDGAGECGQLPTGCKVAGRSLLVLKNNDTDDTRDRLIWQWLKGPTTTLGELGSPASTTNYTLCLYAGTSAAFVALPAGSGWQAVGTKGFKFKDPSGTPDGAQKAVLRSGEAGRAKALLKGKGTNLPDTLAPPLPLPVRAQLVNDTNDTCFEAVYTAATRNDSERFKAKTP